MRGRKLTPRRIVDALTILTLVLLAVFGALDLLLGLGVVALGGVVALMVPGGPTAEKSSR